MSTPNPILVAAAPAIIAALKAIEQFSVNIGTDPTQWAVKVPGAFQVLLGTIELQLPVVAAAEAGALQTDVTAKINALIAKLPA